MSKVDIIMLSTADWDNLLWTNKQHVALTLAKLGHRIFYIESPGMRQPTISSQDAKRFMKKIKKIFSFPRKVRKNIWVWSPMVIPFQKFVLVRLFNKISLTVCLYLFILFLQFKNPILWTYFPLTTCLLSLKIFSKTVYHCVDDLKYQPHMPVKAIDVFEKKLCEEVDIIFVTSKNLFNSRKVWNSECYYFTNVADYDHFSKAQRPDTQIPADLKSIPAPRIGFIGALSGYKQDFNLLANLSRLCRDFSFVLIGKIGEGDPLFKADEIQTISNIYLLGERNYQSLPNYLKGFDRQNLKRPQFSDPSLLFYH